MSKTERQLLQIIVGMVVAFAAVFFIVANLPADKLAWIFGDEAASQDEQQSETDPHQQR